MDCSEYSFTFFQFSLQVGGRVMSGLAEDIISSFSGKEEY